VQSDIPWVRRILSDPDLRMMGHAQSLDDDNLGLGWLYYALMRVARPERAICIGSWRGYVPIVLARAMRDNGNGGRLTFIDPSLVDDFWADPERTRRWFESFELDNVEHHRLTTQEFVASDAYRVLGPVGVLFIDGYHTAEQARFDHEAFAPLLCDDASVFFHDSIRPDTSLVYGMEKSYLHTVSRYVAELKERPGLQVMDFAVDSGVTLVRNAPRPADRIPRPPGQGLPSSLRALK